MKVDSNLNNSFNFQLNHSLVIKKKINEFHSYLAIIHNIKIMLGSSYNK